MRESKKIEEQKIKRSWLSRHFRKITDGAIWVGFFLLLYLLRAFLALIFITFILTYAINSLLNFLLQKISLPRWGMVLLIFSCLVTVIIGLGMNVFPRVYQESKSISKEIPEAKDKLVASLREIFADPDYARFLDGLDLENTLKEKASSIFQSITDFLQKILRTGFHVLLALVFSFLIIWDLDRLKEEVKSLERTKLGRIYRVISPKLIQFGSVVGRAFEAQIMIAIVNTILTLIGLTFLGIPSKLFLSVFVFVCSFVPVLGMIFSSIPICLLAYKIGGIVLVVYSILLVAVIHFIEAYLLNPRIVGGHFSVSPFISVCILVVSEHWFGIWGLLLGVPCAVFIYHSFIFPQDGEKPVTKAENMFLKVD